MKTLYSEVTKVCENLYTVPLGSLGDCEKDLCVLSAVIESDITMKTRLPVFKSGGQYYILLNDELVKVFSLQNGVIVELDEGKGELRLIGKKYEHKVFKSEHYIPCPELSPVPLKNLHKVSINRRGLVKVFFVPEEGLEAGDVVTVYFTDTDRKVRKKVYDFYRGLKFLQFGKKESKELCPGGWGRRVLAEVCKCECAENSKKIVFIKCV